MKPVRMFALLFVLALMTGAMGCHPAPMGPPPQGPTAQDYFNSGMQAYNAGDCVTADQQFEYCIQMNPNFIEAYQYLGICYQRTNMIRRAEKVFLDGLNVNPNFLPIRELLGLLYFNERNYMAARVHLEFARNLNSSNPQVYYALGMVYITSNLCPPAIDAYTRALQLDPNHAMARQGMADANRQCAPAQPPVAPGPPVRQEKKFKGGGMAIDPSDF